MARCGCTSVTCSCSVKGSSGVVVTGVGTLSRPYLISVDAGKIVADDTPTLDMRLSGDGTGANPYHLSGVVTAKLDDLTDVTAAGPTSGQVLAYDSAAQQWKPVPPVTAPVGAVVVGNGITGDGSAGAPLTARANAALGIQVDGNGIGLQSGILAAINASAARKTASGKGVLNYTTASTWMSIAIVFPAGTFTKIPNVVAAPNESISGANIYSMICYDITTSGCRIGARLTAAVSTGLNFNWIARTD